MPDHPACAIDVGSVMASLYERARSLAASLTLAELREEEALAHAVLDALCDAEIAAGRGYEDAPPEIERAYDRWVLLRYAVIEKEKAGD